MSATRQAPSRFPDSARPTRRAMVTGIGAMAPNGIGTEAFWAATLAGRTGIGPVVRIPSDAYPLKLAGEIGDFDAKGWVPSRLAVETDRWTHLGLVAAEMALADAQADPDTL